MIRWMRIITFSSPDAISRHMRVAVARDGALIHELAWILLSAESRELPC
jgi:hypothetical protein